MIGSRKEDAVSPVVGVMLMLVVTIIIAAVVSAFAGGMASSQKATPNMAVEGTYSQTEGMTIAHIRGDPVALSEVQFRTAPSELFGADANKFAWNIDRTIIRNAKNEVIFNNATGFYNTSAFVAGDVLRINPENCLDYTKEEPAPWGDSKDPHNPPGVNANARVLWGIGNEVKNQYFAAYAFANPDHIGKYFYLDVVDPTGNIINRAKVTITG